MDVSDQHSGSQDAEAVWQQAGDAWGRSARDWAYLLEPYARPANDAVFDALGVGARTSLLDIACGSGYAASVAAARGADVSGLDASENLIAIAKARTPGDFRVGDMFALPFGDGSFDAVTSFNGIWKGDDAALVEAARVVRQGGGVGITFWGPPKRLGLLPYFMTVASLSPPSHADATINQGDTGRPGVAEAMFEAAGLVAEARGSVAVVNEWPDLDIAVRALVAAGPSIPAIETVGEHDFAEALREALAPLEDPVLGLRVVSEFGWLTGRAP
jgi:SAM-dependent methyltransferase